MWSKKCYNENSAENAENPRALCADGRNILNNLGRGNEEKTNSNRILTRETLGIVLELFALLSLVILLTRSVVFGSVGFAISSFLLGVFGYCAYAALAALVYGGAVLITGKRLTAPRKIVVPAVLLFVCLVCLVHTITAAAGGIAYGSYGEYLAACYRAGENSFFHTTGGGVLFGILVYPVAKLTTSVGGYIIFSLLMIGCGYLIYAAAKGGRFARRKKAKPAEQPQPLAGLSSDTSGIYDLNYAAVSQPTSAEQPYAAEQASAQGAQPSAQSVQAPAASAAERSKRLYSVGDEFDMKTRREMRQETRRAEAQQRAQQQAQRQDQPLSPYAQSHSLLYPDRTAGDYSWYREQFGGSASPSSSRSSSSSESAPYSSYTNNRIFDKDSYFNNPNRGKSLAEQYSNNFRSPSSFSEGHELRSARSEVQPPNAGVSFAASAESISPSAPSAPATYSGMYSDEVESNISYTVRPKKIVTDTTRAEDMPRAEADYYRNDVTTGEEGVLSSRRPFAAEPKAEAIPTERGTVRSSDAGEIARRVGFGSIETHRSAPTGETSLSAGSGAEPPRTSFVRDAGQLSSFERETPAEAPSPETPSRLSAERPARGASEFSARTEMSAPFGTDEQSAEPPVQTERSDRMAGPERFERSDRTEISAETGDGEEGERSGLQPVTDSFDSAVNLFDDAEEDAAESSVPEAMDRVTRSRRETPADSSRARAESVPMPVVSNEPAPARRKHIYARYNAPPVDLLNDYQSALGSDLEEREHNKEIIVETLSNLKIPCEVVKVTQGPAVTRYDIDIPGNIPTGRVLSCDRELAMRLHAKDGVNIQTNYENGSISIEVPNKQRATVGLKEIIQSQGFVNSKPGSLMFGLGKDIEGRSICGDIKKMKHLLVAGSTGSGKSVCLNALIISLLYKYSPEELRIILVDPKQVEFNIYEKLPHLMINEIIFEPAKVINVLNWAITEMERRYSLFKQKTKGGVLVREIDEYNANLQPDEEMLPKIVFIIDELADLMQAAKKDIEDRIQRLTQKSRAAGIHLVLATQRPSVNVITGVIKTNLSTRIGFKVTQEVDSRTILDESGAEKLLGNGDMLYRTDTMTFPVRVQGAFLSSAEVQGVVEYVKEHNEAYFDDSVSDYINNAKNGGGGESGGDDDGVEAVYIEALRHVVQIGQASISMIQRRCSVGYPKAGKIIEWMENMGYISAFDGAKARKVLLTKEEFESKYGDFGE